MTPLRDTAAPSASSGPPPNVFLEMCTPTELRFLSSAECMAPGRGRAGVNVGKWACHRQFVGWVRQGLRETWGGADLIKLMQLQNWLCSGEGSTQARWHPYVDCPVGRPNKRAMTAVPPAVVLALHNSVFPCISLMPPKLLTLHQCSGQVSVSE